MARLPVLTYESAEDEEEAAEHPDLYGGQALRLGGVRGHLGVGLVDHVRGALLDSRGKNGHGLGVTFHLTGQERRTPSDGVPKHEGSFV